MVFNAHLIVAGESARFGYPPSRVWGVPEAPWTWVARMGLQQARRYMLTGDEFTAAEAQAMGVVLEVVPDDELAGGPMALAQRIALVPANQLEMITWALNAVADHQYDPTRRAGSARSSTASPATARRASTSSAARRRSASARRCASGTARSATTANVLFFLFSYFSFFFFSSALMAVLCASRPTGMRSVATWRAHPRGRARGPRA